MDDTSKQPTISIDSNSDFLTYSYRPRMMGADYSFQLAPQALAWDIGKRTGRILYHDIERVRLSFRPSNFASNRFVAEIWSNGGLKLSIASVSARSLFDFENRGPAYRDFVKELSRKIAASGAHCIFEAGFPSWRWWPAFTIGMAAILAALYLCARTLLAGELAIAAILGALGVYFCWQIGSMIVRNYPRIFTPPEIPESIMPRA